MSGGSLIRPGQRWEAPPLPSCPLPPPPSPGLAPAGSVPGRVPAAPSSCPGSPLRDGIRAREVGGAPPTLLSPLPPPDTLGLRLRLRRWRGGGGGPGSSSLKLAATVNRAVKEGRERKGKGRGPSEAESARTLTESDERTRRRGLAGKNRKETKQLCFARLLFFMPNVIRPCVRRSQEYSIVQNSVNGDGIAENFRYIFALLVPRSHWVSSCLYGRDLSFKHQETEGLQSEHKSEYCI